MTTIHWIAASGNWNAPGNWSTSTVPGPLDDAVLDATGTYTVTSSSNVTVNSLSGNSGATLDITAGIFTVNNFGAQGPLILSGGLLSIGSSVATIASFSQSGSGTLNVGGTLTVTGPLVFTGGTDSGGGVIIAQGGATLFTAAAQGFTLSDATLELEGTSTAGGAGNFFNNGITLSNGAQLVIESGATFSSQNNQTGPQFDFSINGSGAVAVINEGTFVNSAGWVTFQQSWALAPLLRRLHR